MKEPIHKTITTIMKRINLLACAILLCWCADAQTWKLIDPLPTNKSLYASSFINANEGWICGQNNTLLKTSDGGNTWITDSVSANQTWSGIQFINNQKGWICSSTGVIEATNDGGSSWSQQLAGFLNFYFAQMQFLDAMHGFVLREYDSLYYTTDGGTQWKKAFIEHNFYHYGLSFANTSDGWVCGSSGYISHSADAGITWNTQTTNTDKDLYSINFIDNKNGWASGYTSSGGVLLHTTDGGVTWNKIFDDNALKFYKIVFKDNLNGFALDDYGENIYQTSDGGVTWNIIFVSPSNQEILNDFTTAGSSALFTYGSGGIIEKSSNNGSTWSAKYKTATHGASIKLMRFTDNMHGYVLGDSLRRTTDGGNTWSNRTPTNAGFSTSSFYFLDSLKGWAVGKVSNTTGEILHTSDGGKNYSVQLTGNNPFISIDFFDAMHGLAGTIDKTIYYTSNGGATWNSASIPSSVSNLQILKVQMVDAQTGYATASQTYNTMLAKTTDGGATWQIIKTNTTEFTTAFPDLQFLDAQHGYLATFTLNGNPNKSSLLYTADGGQNWDTINLSSASVDLTANNVNTIYFNDVKHGWVAGGGFNSFILYTSDGGATWSTQEYKSCIAWYTLSFGDDETGYVAGFGGNIARMNSNVLPLTLLNFSASLQNKNVLLNWNTANEINTDKFIVERSNNTKDFTDVGTVYAALKNSGSNSYSFTDDVSNLAANASTLYYRLKMLDKDGSFSFSNVERISLTAHEITLQPNPATNWFMLSGGDAVKQVQLYTTAGLLLKTMQASSAQQYVISDIKPGIYIVKVLMENSTQSFKLYKR